MRIYSFGHSSLETFSHHGLEGDKPVIHSTSCCSTQKINTLTCRSDILSSIEENGPGSNLADSNSNVS